MTSNEKRVPGEYLRPLYGYKPSLMPYDRRDPLEPARKVPKIVVWALIGAALVTIMHFTLGPLFPDARAEEATVSPEKLIDEGVLCANPITSPDEIDRYCVKLAKQLSL